MIVPTYSQEQIVDESGVPTSNFDLLLRQLLQGLQLYLSDDGYLVPSISSDPADNELAVLQASFQGNTVNNESQTVTNGVRPGTIIFDPYELNGGAVGPPRVPKGQLKVLLNDGTFHAIVNL